MLYSGGKLYNVLRFRGNGSINCARRLSLGRFAHAWPRSNGCRPDTHLCMYVCGTTSIFFLQTTRYHATCYETTYCVRLTHLRGVCYRKGSRDNSVCVRAAGAVGGATHTTRKSSRVAVAAHTGTSTYNTKDHTKHISTNIHLLKIYTVRRSTQSKYSWCRCARVCVCVLARVATLVLNS